MNQTDKINRIVTEVSKVIIGKQECIETVLCAILAGGHILIEDVPGVGKTSMAMAFGAAMELECNRVQFTPDIMPSDIIGFTMYQKENEQFYYQPGSVLCNLFLADEINRTSPKTQSALLEVMEENSVTVDAVTREVPQPFIVIATENPSGYVGTQMLPESQLDRFAVSVVMGFPSNEAELRILKTQAKEKPIDHVTPVISRNELINMIEDVKEVLVRVEIYAYIVNLANETRKHPGISLGLSPRGSLAIASLARAAAYMRGRTFVIPDDVVSVFYSAVRHRLVLSSEAKMNHQSIDQIIQDVLKRVTKPTPERIRF